MCSSLTDQVRSIANVTTAVAKGDLTQKIEIEVEGEMSTLKRTVNSMVDQLSAFASEVTRVALEVGTQGILGGQARVEGVQGTWADLTRNVNVRITLYAFVIWRNTNNFLQKMANNLTDQVRSISEVTKAVALGDLGKTVEVDVQGEMLDLKMTVNSMVAQLSTLADEVTRVSLEVGTEGLLGGQAFVPDVEGMWKVGLPVCMGAENPIIYLVTLGPHRQCQLDGNEFDKPSPFHRRGDESRRRRRLDQEDRCRRTWRDFRVEGDCQRHDGVFECVRR